MLIRKTPQQPVEAGEDAMVGFRRPLTQVLAAESQSDVSSEGTPASQTQFIPRRCCLGKQRTQAHKAMLQQFHRLATRGALGPSVTSKHPAQSTLLMQHVGHMASRLARRCTEVSKWARPPARSRSFMPIANITSLVMDDHWIGGCSDEALTGLQRLFNVQPYQARSRVSR